MKLILPDGRSPGGADAMLEIARKTIFGWPLVLLALLPGVRPLLCAAYRCVAARRRSLNCACSVKRTSTFIGRLLVGFGCLTFFYAAAFVFDVRPYLTNWFYRIGYHAINLVFVYLLAVYVLAAWKGGSL
jgi:dolichyl-phosphate-mannose--protein O-mannosyl transferase